MLPFLQQLLCLGVKDLAGTEANRSVSEGLLSGEGISAYSSLSGVADVSVCVEQGPDVDCLAPPYVALHRPIEGDL